jgi:predicted phage baseplate assembly protein
MPLDIPNLDDRRWADLVEDARALIPIKAPRWTDHNVHDPGITFIELFAWLAEMQIYQLNRVGEKHREVFGRLAGIRRRQRTPARVEILAIGGLTTSMRLPAETRLTPLEGDEIIFETTQDIVFTRSTLVRVVVDDGSGAVDQTDANNRFGIEFLAFGDRARGGAQLRLGFDRFYPETESTIRLSVDVFTEDLGTRCGSDLPIPADARASRAVRQPVTLAWEYLGPGGQWDPLDPVTDETAALSHSGAVTLPVPSDAATQSKWVPGLGAGTNLVWIRAVIRRGAYDIEPRLRHIGVNGLPCVQTETVRDQLLGRGDGNPDQVFPLSPQPVLVPESGSPVEIEVGGALWQPVTSFDDAGPASEQYVLDAEGGRILFGNGLNGRVPGPGQDVRARRYQISAGRSGNIARDLPWKFLTAVVPGVTLKNPEPATGGADPESLNDMELRARAYLNRPNRAVTLNDIERLALGTPGVYVARAHALVNCPAPGQITVVVVPKVRPGRKGPPPPASDAFLDVIRRHLQQRRLLCDNIRVIRPVLLEVRVAARLRLAKGAGGAAVIERARQALDRFLRGDTLDALSEPVDPDTLPSPCPTRWPFGRSVFPSEIFAILDGVSGVDAVSSVMLTAVRGGVDVSRDATGAIPVPLTGLVFSGTHDLAIGADVRRRG